MGSPTSLEKADKHWVEIFTLHSALFYVNINALVYDIQHVNFHGENVYEYNGYAGKFKYLTFISQNLQALYFGLCVLNDLFGTNAQPGDGQSKSFLQKLRDYMLAAVAFPLGTFVVITFWGIYAVDRELVFPARLDSIIPSWLNHVMHTTVLPFLLAEMYFVYHEYPSRSKGLTGTVGFALCYQIWILWIAYYAGFWVYPVMEVLSWTGRLAFFAGLWVFMLVIYMAGESINKTFWGSKQKKLQKVH